MSYFLQHELITTVDIIIIQLKVYFKVHKFNPNIPKSNTLRLSPQHTVPLRYTYSFNRVHKP